MMLASQNLAFQALSKNTNLLVGNFVRPVGGPGTTTILEEIAAHSIGAVASGVSYVYGVHSAMGNTPSHTSGLESRFMGEISHGSSGVTRKEADEIVRQIVSLYQEKQSEKPIGKPFDQVYDLDSIRPTEEWSATFETVKEHLSSLGLTLQ